MKKLILFVALFAVAGLTSVSAQTTKTCTKAEKKACMKSATACASTTAAKMAAADENIEARTCATTGNVSYVRKSVCPMSGNVSYANVEYSSATGTFVSAGTTKEAKAVTEQKVEKKACTKGAKKKGCCAKKAKA